MAEKKYREQYTDHCIRHPKDAVSYTTFRWRMRNWWPKLAIRLGKLESAPKMSEKIHEKNRKRMLHTQKEMQERRMKDTCAKVLRGVILITVGIVIWTML
jgi:hypothetical protein